jgi:uncharacterized protein with HEPN domain
LIDDKTHLLHIRDAIEKAIAFTEAGEEAFMQDARTQDAVIRNLEVIGEAVKCLSPELKDTYSSIPWKRIAGMRDKMIHEYFGVNLYLVYDVVKLELPGLKEQIEEMLRRLG